jgi:uncharacterized protein with HEPN domain
MLDEDRIRLNHMRDAAAEALSFVANKTRLDLDNDRKLVLALLKSIEIIGEAAAKVSPGRKAESTEVPWRDIIAMRNRLIHAYFDIDLDILWQTVTSELPPLLEDLERLLSTGPK